MHKIHTHNRFTALDSVRDNPGEPVPEETFTHSHLSWSSIILYLLNPFIINNSILPIQFTCLTVFLHNLSPSFLWSTWLTHFILHIFLHTIIVFFSLHMPIPSQPVLLYNLPLTIIDISLLVSNGTNCLNLFHTQLHQHLRLHSTCHLNNKTYPLTPDLHWHQFYTCASCTSYWIHSTSINKWLDIIHKPEVHYIITRPPVHTQKMQWFSWDMQVDKQTESCSWPYFASPPWAK